MDLQRIQVKLLSNAPASLDLNPFIEIFGRWRADRNHPAGWVDLADYAHVPRGPGIVLVGFNANFSFDMTADSNGTGETPGILYFTKKGLSGSHLERIAASLRSCLDLSKRLVAEREFPKNIQLRANELEIRFPDRLLTPNTAAIHKELRPPVERALDGLFGSGGYALTLHQNEDEAPGYSVRAHNPSTLESLSERLG
jgi:hypothetical protein